MEQNCQTTTQGCRVNRRKIRRDVGCDVFCSDGGHINKMVWRKGMRRNFVQFVCLGVTFTTKCTYLLGICLSGWD